MTGPHCGKCASPLCGPGILMLGLASNEGLGLTGEAPLGPLKFMAWILEILKRAGKG